jgi:hypothetical protein
MTQKMMKQNNTSHNNYGFVVAESKAMKPMLNETPSYKPFRLYGTKDFQPIT